MKKIYLLLIFLSIKMAFGCGFMIDSESYYYSLFLNKAISKGEFNAITLDKNRNHQNISQWEKFTKKNIPKKELELIIYHYPKEYFEDALQNKGCLSSYVFFKSNEGKETLKYLKLIRKFESIDFINDDWIYTEEDIDYSEIISEATVYYNTFKSKEIKDRLAYQIIRLYRYSKQFDNALTFYKNHENDFSNPITYYTLEQIAGIEYYLGKEIVAFKKFAKVLTECQDRSYTSKLSMKYIDLTKAKNLNNLTLSEKETLHYFNALEKRIPRYLAINELFKLNPNSNYIKPLLLSVAEDLSKIVLRNDFAVNYYTDEYSFEKQEVAKAKANEFIFWVNQNKNHFKNTDFYNSFLSYMYFLTEDYSKSNEVIALIKPNADKIYQSQKVVQEILNILSENKVITPNIEEDIYHKYQQLEISEMKKEDSYYDLFATEIRHYIFDLLAKRYKFNRQIAKSFLCHHNLEYLKENLDLDLINNIEAFWQKKDKNNLEKVLAVNLNSTTIDMFNDLRGTFYLQRFELKKAQKAFIQLPDTYRSTLFDSWVNSKELLKTDKSLFYTHLDDHYNKSKKADDSFMDQYSFLEKINSKKTLTNALVKLDSLSVNGIKSDKMWSGYLIGNFLTNISFYGYNRHYFYYSNTGHGDYLSSVFKNFDFEKEKDYKKITRSCTLLNLSEKTNHYYTIAFNNTNSKEFKAQILFMQAKYEQFSFYNELDSNDSFWKYSLEYSPEERAIKNTKYRIYFNKLKAFKQTRFYKEQLKNCSFFYYYQN